jgi:hypothetical protein
VREEVMYLLKIECEVFMTFVDYCYDVLSKDSSFRQLGWMDLIYSVPYVG